MLSKAVDLLEAKHPEAARVPVEGELDILAYAFPEAHWKTNPLERLNKELRRRVRSSRTGTRSSVCSGRCWWSRTTSGGPPTGGTSRRSPWHCYSNHPREEIDSPSSAATLKKQMEKGT